MLAANGNYADLVELLLAAGADPRARAADGWTAVEAAQMVGATDIVTLLENAASAD